MLEKFNDNYVLKIKMEKTITKDDFLEGASLKSFSYGEIVTIEKIVNEKSNFEEILVDFFNSNVNAFKDLKIDNFIVIDDRITTSVLENDDCVGVAGNESDYKKGNIYLCDYDFYITINGETVENDTLIKMFSNSEIE